jgi:hypothetical protein
MTNGNEARILLTETANLRTRSELKRLRIKSVFVHFRTLVTDLKINPVTGSQGTKSVSKISLRISAQFALLPVDNPPNLFSIKLARIHLSKLSAAEYVKPNLFRGKRCNKEVATRRGRGGGGEWKWK